MRSAAEEAVARASGEERPALRIVHRADHGQALHKPKRDQAGKGKGARKAAAAGPPAAQRPRPVRDGGRLQEAIIRGARALDRGYEREALRILRPYREPHPDSANLSSRQSGIRVHAHLGRKIERYGQPPLPEA